MNEPKDELNKLLEEASKGSTQIVASPDTIKKLVEKGVLKKTFITYQNYSDKIYKDRKKDAVSMLSKLPLLDETIADSVLTSIYEEILVSIAFGILTSAIVNSIMLLEYSMRTRLYKEIQKSDPNSEWFKLERMDMDALIQGLSKYKIINNNDKKSL